RARPRGLEDGSQALEGKVRLRLHTLGRFHRGVDPDLTGNPDRVPHTGRLREVQGVVQRSSSTWVDRLSLRGLGSHVLIPSYELAEGGRTEGISRGQGRHLFDEEDAIPRVTRIAVVRQRAEGRVVAEETEDQGVALREGCVDRRAAVERAGMDHDHVSGVGRPGENIVGVWVELSLSLDVG